MDHQILLYYSYAFLDDAEALSVRQRELCESLGLKGRIIVASEGLNGTLEGTVEATNAYVKDFLSDPRFADTTLKYSPSNGGSFSKLSVKYRSEIVSAHLGERDVHPRIVTGKYLEAEELHSWFKEGREFYIVDMRNDYEHQSGHFVDSILPNLGNFRDLPKILPDLEHLRNKTVVTVCTGGVRCEKASGFLVENGFAGVYQLKDGIVTYMEKYPNQEFQGVLYVFDGRVTMGFNLDEPDRAVIGRCELCGAASERYVNCANDECHRHFICCENCSALGPVLCIREPALTLA